MGILGRERKGKRRGWKAGQAYVAVEEPRAWIVAFEKQGREIHAFGGSRATSRRGGLSYFKVWGVLMLSYGSEPLARIPKS